MAHRLPKHKDPVVYVYLNVVTEMVYVGSSLYGLDSRHRSHRRAAARHPKLSKFYRALQDWPDEFWERTVLERCTEDQLGAVEDKWTIELNAVDSAVGYNTYLTTHNRPGDVGGQAMQDKVYTAADKLQLALNGLKAINPNATFDDVLTSRQLKQARDDKRAAFRKLTPEQKQQFFIDCGKQGAHFGDTPPDATPEVDKPNTRGSQLNTIIKRTSSPLYGLSPDERREYFRAAGRRGAAKSLVG